MGQTPVAGSTNKEHRISSTQAVTASRALCNLSTASAAVGLRQWAGDNFPGVTDVAVRGVQLGGGTERGLIGTWHGMRLRFKSSPCGPRAHAYARCDCCNLWARATPSTPALRCAADIARKYDVVPPATVAQCFHCRWLHQAQPRAAHTTGRLARALFRYDFGHTPEDVLSMDCHEVLPAP